MAVTSAPGPDNAYAIGDDIEITVTFSAAVTVTGQPQLALSIGQQPRTATYDGGSGAAAVVFAYTVVENDQGDAVAIGADAITLNGGTISNSTDSDVAADLSHDSQSADHRVDGVRPSLGSAAVDGAALTLTYGEELDGTSVPATGAFCGERGRNKPRGRRGLDYRRIAVSLTLASAVTSDDTVTVSYTPPADPSASRIRDLAGNAAAVIQRAGGGPTTPSRR